MAAFLDRRRVLSLLTASAVSLAGCSTRPAAPQRSPAASTSPRPTEHPSSVPTQATVDGFGLVVDATASFDPTAVLYGSLGVSLVTPRGLQPPTDGDAVVWDTVDETRTRRLGAGMVPLPTRGADGTPDTIHADRGLFTPLPGRPVRRFSLDASTARDGLLFHSDLRLFEFVFSPVATIRDSGPLTRTVAVDHPPAASGRDGRRETIRLPIVFDDVGGRTELALVFDVTV